MILPNRSGALAPEPLPDHAAHRQPAPMRLRDIEVVEDRQHVAAETLDRIGARRNARLAVAAAVVADHTKKLRQRLHLRLPHLQGAAERVRQHQGRSAIAALDGNVEQATVGIDHRHLGFLRRLACRRSRRAAGRSGPAMGPG